MSSSKHSLLVKGPISPKKVAELISEHQTKTDLGAHSLFLGQVRADEKNESKVVYIEYSAYDEMAEKEISNIKEDAIKKFELTCVHINHSLGNVKAGELSLLVMVSAPHRENCLESLKFIVSEIKKRVPIWKKEKFEDGSYRWVE